MKPIGPHSRPGKLAKIDGRLAEARRMKTVREELTVHLGGRPSATQRMMIERAAMLTLRLELMDKRALKAGSLSATDTHHALAWENALSRLLRHLGLEGAPPPKPTLAQHLAVRAA